MGSATGLASAVRVLPGDGSPKRGDLVSFDISNAVWQAMRRQLGETARGFSGDKTRWRLLSSIGQGGARVLRWEAISGHQRTPSGIAVTPQSVYSIPAWLFWADR